MRLIILMCSMGCVIAYGYALAGYVGGVFGYSRPHYILWGLIFGTLCGVAALFLWKKFMPLFIITDGENEQGHDGGQSAAGEDEKKD